MAKVTTTHSKYKGVVVNTTDYKAVNRSLLKRKEELERLLIKRFTMTGEECVRIARESGSYNDITGNLRSSIGYVVLKDGQPVVEGAPKQFKGRGENMQLVSYKDKKTGKDVKYWAKGKSGDGSDGVQAAEAFLKTLQAKFPRGIVLIVCAGMNYAAYVENVRHKDVLTTAELLMESLIRKHLTNNGIVK